MNNKMSIDTDLIMCVRWVIEVAPAKTLGGRACGYKVAGMR